MINYKKNKTIFSIVPRSGKEKVIATIDHKDLHKFILNKVGTELSKVSEICYYPRVKDIYKELLHKTGSNEKDLIKYGKINFPPPLSHVVRDSFTILLILIAKDFTDRNDTSAALSTINLLSLHYYSNLMYKYIKYCNSDYFRSAMEKLSHNHLFVKRKTIGQSILYLSEQVYKKYKRGLLKNNFKEIYRLIIDLRNRFNQSIKSFAKHYYNISENQHATRLTSEEIPEKENLRKKIEKVSALVTRNITVYGNVDYDAAREAQRLTRFNKVLSMKYAQELSNTKYTDDLELLIMLFLSTIGSTTSKMDYISHTRKLMALKQTTKKVYYKKTLINIHTQITENLGYSDDFERLSVQSKAISRKFLAYYITIMIYDYLKG